MMWKAATWPTITVMMMVGSAHAEKTNACDLLIGIVLKDGKYFKQEKIQRYLENCNALGGQLCEGTRRVWARQGAPDPGFACREHLKAVEE